MVWSTLIAICFCMSFCLVSCKGGGKKTEQETVKQVFTFSNGTEPETLDPGKMTGLPESAIAINLFEGLVTLDPQDLRPIPGAAERWEVSGDGLVYTFYLRKNAMWSNGNRVTAHDFFYSWKRVLEPATASEYAYQAYYVKNGRAYNTGELKDFSKVGLKVIDDHTFRVELENPTPFFLDIAAFHTLMPVNEKCVEKHGDKWTRPENIITNGAFLLTEWKPRDRIVLVKNNDYWDAAAVKLQKVTILPTDDENTYFKMYEAGETEWIKSVPLPQIPKMKKRADYHATEFLGTYYYLFNVTRKPLNDPRVRKALNMAIDKKQITEYITKAGQIPTATFTPKNIPGYKPPEGLPYDVDRARKLLTEAGYPNGKGFPKLTILYNTSEAHRAIAETIQQMWKANLNINVEIYNEEWKVYLKDTSSLNYDIARAGWIGDYTDPNTFLDMWVTGGGNNRAGWSNKRYDALIAEAARTIDQKKRIKIFQEAENLLINEEMPIMPIYHYVNVNMIKPWVKGIHFNIRDYHPMKYVYIVKH
ncbi:MAG: peptide ABC transporter substrate-binding protein [bacterium]